MKVLKTRRYDLFLMDQGRKLQDSHEIVDKLRFRWQKHGQHNHSKQTLHTAAEAAGEGGGAV